jgi:hypothetical protein
MRSPPEADDMIISRNIPFDLSPGYETPPLLKKERGCLEKRIDFGQRMVFRGGGAKPEDGKSRVKVHRTSTAN